MAGEPGGTAPPPDPDVKIPRLPSLRLSTIAVAVPLLGGRLLYFAGGIVLARWLGASIYGAYGWLLSWVAVLTTASMFGFDVLLVREVASHSARGELHAVAGLHRLATRTSLLIGLMLGALAVVALPAIARPGSGVTAIACACVGIAAVSSALIRVGQSVLRGIHRPVIAQLPDAVIQPAVMLLLGGGALLAAARPSLLAAITINASGAVVGFLCTLVFMRRFAPLGTATIVDGLPVRARLVSASRLLALTVVTTLQARIDIVLLGAIGGVAAVGPYTAAVSGSSLVATALNLVVTAVAPSLAALANTKQHKALGRVARSTTTLALAGGLPVAIVMIVGGGLFLGLYGPGFGVARTALTVLCVGQLVNVASGPVSTVLTMSGYESDSLIALAAATAIEAVLCIALIPRWGMNGAAIASAAALSVWNIALWVMVRRRLGIVLVPIDMMR